MSVVAWLGFGRARAQESTTEPEPTPADQAATPPAETPAEGSLPPQPSPSSVPTPMPATAPNTAQVNEPAAPPVADTGAPRSTEPAARQHDVPQIGIAPGAPQTGTLDLAAPPAATMSATPVESDWKFEFHGFLRAPMRLGVGSGNGFPAAQGTGDKWHSPPQIPDGTFTDWNYTNNLPGPWAELRFQYGNNRVTGNALIAAYNMTDGGYRNLQSQLGINQAFITLNEADLFGSDGGLVWNVGVFQNRYGAAGRYDAGKYETYLFGRTHVAGETLTGFYNLSDTATLTLEHGVGAKLEMPPQVAGLPDPSPPYLPYAGPVQQGTQLVHHAHLAFTYDKLQLGAHYITTWTDDARVMGEQDGRITVTGGDLRLTDSRYGDGYIGYSHVSSRTPLRVGEGLELLHSLAGWNLRDNFFGPAATGSGRIDTVMLQYTFSFARYLRYPESFWGQGPDILVSVFGMYNHVGSDDPKFTLAENKLKWGADATYTPFSFLGVSMRFDRVQPDLDNSQLAFDVLSPKIILRSTFVTHEQLVLQYSRYLYGSKVRAAWPAVGLMPDKDAFMIAAIMWW